MPEVTGVQIAFSIVGVVILSCLARDFIEVKLAKKRMRKGGKDE